MKYRRFVILAMTELSSFEQGPLRPMLLNDLHSLDPSLVSMILNPMFYRVNVERTLLD